MCGYESAAMPLVRVSSEVGIPSQPEMFRPRDDDKTIPTPLCRPNPLLDIRDRASSVLLCGHWGTS